ncbi:TonB-dependent siderophore receptor [Campylobacter concisus]|uniref:TonB-dependent siderophore receptor n=1 Tax=Campylobacter concisus TaxID=199 RepID=UPI001F2815BD|nr:TonB-dependent receptor plug domain-containing protein [Campylobacter concisus]
MNKFCISVVLCFAISALNATDVSLDGISIEDSADDGYRATTSEVGKTNTPILEIPQTVNVVTQQQLKDKKPETLAESLQNVSGVSYGNTTGGIFDSIIKRGFGGGRDGSIMRNGVPASVMHSFNKTVESVEVLKGPASLLYGAQEPGGIINMVTKKPKYDFSNEIWAGIGNRNYWNTGLILQDRSQRAALRIDLYLILCKRTTGESLANIKMFSLHPHFLIKVMTTA